MAYLKDSTGPLLDPLQFAYRANRSVDDAVNMGLHYILQHLERPGTFVRILFVDFSSAFNTIIPDTLQNKLTQLSVPTSVCQWITSFLRDRQQLVRLGNSHPAPVRSVLELLRAAFSPHCSSPSTRTTAHLKTPLSSSWSLQTTPHWSASSRMVTSLLTDRRLRNWLSGAVLTTWSLTRSKPWKLSWTSGETPLLSPTHHHEQHCDCSEAIQITGRHNFSGPEVGQSHWVHCEKGPAEVVLPSPAEEVQPATGAADTVQLCHHWIRPLHVNNCLVQLQELYLSRVSKRAGKITLDPSHPAHSLFELLPSGRRYRALSTRTTSHRNSFFPQAIHLMNTWH